MAISLTGGPTDGMQAFMETQTLAEGAQTVAQGEATAGAAQAGHMQSANNQSENIGESAQTTQSTNLANQQAMSETARQGNYLGALMDLQSQEMAIVKKGGQLIANSV